jgi:predicted RNA-binding Zn ribbon-like protein
VRWARHAGALDDAQAERLLGAAGRPAAARTSVAAAVTLREAIYRVFAAIAHGATPAGPSGCGFLFLDTTKNRGRRWCSMGECGGQVKASRQTARRRAARAGAR